MRLIGLAVMKVRILGTVAVAVLVLAAAVVSSTLAFNEPDGFRGIPWGASEEAVRAQMPGLCLPSVGGDFFGEVLCSRSFTIGNVPVDELLSLRSGGFVGVSFSFDPKYFILIEAAFKDRYGNPTGTNNEEGNVRHEWRGTKVYILLWRYVSANTKSLATIQTVAEREKQFKGLRDQPKTGAGDL
jgi:hypothetical protein